MSKANNIARANGQILGGTPIMESTKKTIFFIGEYTYHGQVIKDNLAAAGHTIVCYDENLVNRIASKKEIKNGPKFDLVIYFPTYSNEIVSKNYCQDKENKRSYIEDMMISFENVYKFVKHSKADFVHADLNFTEVYSDFKEALLNNDLTDIHKFEINKGLCHYAKELFSALDCKSLQLNIPTVISSIVNDYQWYPLYKASQEKDMELLKAYYERGNGDVQVLSFDNYRTTTLGKIFNFIRKPKNTVFDYPSVKMPFNEVIQRIQYGFWD